MPLFIVAYRPFFCFLILPSNQHMFFVPQISQIHTDSWFGFKVTQIWLSLRPPIFNSQMTQIFLDLFGQMTQIFPTAVTPKGYFRTKGDDVICRLCLAKLLYCGEVFDMHTLPEGIQ